MCGEERMSVYCLCVCVCEGVREVFVFRAVAVPLLHQLVQWPPVGLSGQHCSICGG